MRLLVVNANTSDIVTAVTALVMWLLSLGGLGYAWALVDRDRHFLHDRLLGTRLALRHGAGFVRGVFIVVVGALILKTGYDAFLR